MNAVLSRSDRDIHVHPSTRLPGTDIIETCITRELARNEPFAVAYADLDHFKEFNDRYGYHEGDRVIRVLARILHDVVKGVCGEGGFIGHIGGDDFIFIIPARAVQSVCAEIVEVFDLLVPFPVFRVGSTGGLLLRQGSTRATAPCAAHDAFDWRRYE